MTLGREFYVPPWKELRLGLWIAIVPASKNLQIHSHFPASPFDSKRILGTWCSSPWLPTGVSSSFLNYLALSKVPLPKSKWLNIGNEAHQQNPGWVLRSLWLRQRELPIPVCKKKNVYTVCKKMELKMFSLFLFYFILRSVVVVVGLRALTALN